MIYLLALLLVILAVILFIKAGQSQRSIGIPVGRVVYSDTGAWSKVEKPLYDPDLHLTGKPDYLVKQKQDVLPGEVQSSPAPASPYDGHMMQLAADCLRVERTTGVRPSHGLIHYANHTFAIDYTPELEAELLDLVVEMRRAERRAEAERSHESKGRCERCGYRSICDQRL